MDDVGALLAEAAEEVQMHSPRRPRGADSSSEAAGGASAARVFAEFGESKEERAGPPSAAARPLTGMDALRQAAHTAAEEERDDSAHAFKSAGADVRKSVEEDYDETFEDANVDVGDVGGLLGKISEDIHSNKIEYDGEDIDQALREAAAELDRPELPVSSPDVSEDEDGGDEDRNRELLQAAAQGDERSVRWLLGHGASHSCRDLHGWTPLHWAASKGNEDIMAILLDSAGDERLSKYVNKVDDLSGWSALHVAVVGGHLKCIKLLMASKGKNYKKNKFDEAPKDGIPFPKTSPEYGACMRALGHEYKSVNSKVPGSSSRQGIGSNISTGRK